MSSAQRVWAVVPAAGSGQRMAQATPKQYCEVLGKTILQHSLDALLNYDAAMEIVVATSADYQQAGMQGSDRVRTVAGGASRSESVMAGLNTLASSAAAEELVFVHDAARPCVSQDEIRALHDAARQSEYGAILALPVTDTLKQREQSSPKIETLPRDIIYQALTPQVFPFALLHRAMSQALEEGKQLTDEASALEHLGVYPELVMGKRSNIKVTFAEDLVLAEAVLRGKLEA